MRGRRGRLLGLPYDLGRPDRARIRASGWNPDDPRLFTPKVWGWGLTANVFWVAHPLRWLRAGGGPSHRNGARR